MIAQTALANWLAREVGEEQAAEIAHSQKCVLVPLDADIAFEAADLRRQFKLATANAVVYATTLGYGDELAAG